MIKLNANKELDRVVAKALFESIDDMGNAFVGIKFNHRDEIYYFIINDLPSQNLMCISEILIPYESAILDPRLLIGEDVPCEYRFGKHWFTPKDEIEILNHLEHDFRIPKQWLQENGMWIEGAGE